MKFLKSLFLMTLVLACTHKQQRLFTYYYWKTNLKFDSIEKTALQKATAPYLYTRFFDVDKMDGKFQPVGVITKDKSFVTDKEIVPVVFIMNRAFLNISEQEIHFLAQSIYSLIQKKTNEFGFKTSKEIQIDCDWTAGTRDDYFRFLTKLKDISKKDVTSTLRLHQVKDQQTMGIPPVSKVYLMCYSTSSPLENSDKNSILDVTIAKNYLSDLEHYPIKRMDVALPIYSWGIVTNHLGKRKLINGLTPEDLSQPNLKKTSETEAEVLKDGFYFGSYLNKGFKIKIEAITGEQREEVIRFIDRKLTDYTIVYYQLDDNFVKTSKL